MTKVFKEEVFQKKFEEACLMHEECRKAIAMKVDLTDPLSIQSCLQEILNTQHILVKSKAMFTFLLDKHIRLKVIAMKDESLSASEKKAIVNAEVGDVQFWDTVSELMIKESHYRIEALRSALSYIKSELNLT